MGEIDRQRGIDAGHHSPTRTKFRHNVQLMVTGVVDDFHQIDNVWVGHFFHQRHFSLQC